MSFLPKQTGMALVAVLWVTTGLAIIVTTIMVQTRTDLQLTRTHVELAEARAMAEAGVYRGVYELLRSREAVRWGVPEDMPLLEWDDAAVRIHIQNEAGKIDVNTAHPALIRSMFHRTGVPAAQSRLMADRYGLLHRLEDDGRTTVKPAAEFPSIEAFAARLNLPAAVWRTISPWITVYNGQAGINPYVADEEVLSIVPGFKSSLLADSTGRGSPDRLQTRSMDLDHRHFTDRLSSVYTIAVHATVGGVSTTVEAIIEMSAHRNRPYTILGWSETPRFRGG